MANFRTICLLGVAFSGLLGCANYGQKAEKPSEITVDIYEGVFPTVNSFVFSNGKSITIMDVQRTSEAARDFLKIVREKALPVTQIFISHGHTDHFMGLDVFHRAFPEAPIVVHTAEIKQDIKNYATWMDNGGWLAEEPALKPKSSKNPNGFDYDNLITVLPSDELTLEGGGSLELTSDYKPNEGEHMTTAYSKDLNGLFLSDFGFNKVHLWMGAGVTRQHVANWREELLNIKARYQAIDPIVYPGHGEPTDLTLVDVMVGYIDDFNFVISNSETEEEARQEMIRLYPGYKEADFLLKWSVNNHFQ